MNGNDVFLLVATPDAPAAVRETVVLVAVHGDQGSLGFILNRTAAGITYRDALVSVGIDPHDLELNGKLCIGGPVRPDAAWLLFDGSAFEASGATLPEDSCALDPAIHVTASAEVTLEVLKHKPGVKTLLCRGHTTWEAGELEAEIAAGQWVRTEARPGLVFDAPLSRRWSEALCTSLGLSRPWLGEASFARA